MRNKDHIFLVIAHMLSTLSTCRRRAVGCVLVDSRCRIIGSGYNGTPSGLVHCIDNPCRHAHSAHGTMCNSSHAEANSLVQCQNPDAIWTVYTTSFPCFECFKLLANTGCKRIVYSKDYPAHRELVEELNAQRSVEFVYRKTDMASIAAIFSAGPIK